MPILFFVFILELFCLVDSFALSVSTFIGAGTSGYYGDGGQATGALVYGPKGVFASTLGDVYLADTGNYRVRKISNSTGIITTVAGIGTTGNTGDGGAATGDWLLFPMCSAILLKLCTFQTYRIIKSVY